MAVTLTSWRVMLLYVYLLKLHSNFNIIIIFIFCFRFMVLTKRICGVLNASGRKPVEDLPKFC